MVPSTSVCSVDPSAHSTSELKKLSIEQLMEVEVETVYGASRYEQKTTDAPSSISIVTSSDIRKFGYRTLADILRSVRGLFVTSDRNYSYLGVRGFGRPGDYNSRILVQIDGHRVNDNVYDEVLIGEDFILDVDLIERVEVVRGPSSSLYGSNAFFAIINIFTRKAEDICGVEASASAGSLDTYKGRLSYGKRLGNGLETVISGSGLVSEGNDTLYYGEFDAADTNNGVTRHTDYENSYNFFTRSSYRDFTLEGAFVSREKGVPTASFGTDFNDPRNATVDRHGYVDLRYERDLKGGDGIVGRLFYDLNEYWGDYIYSGVVNKDYEWGDSWGLELVGKKRFLDRHTFIFGTEYQDSISEVQKNYDQDPFFSYLDDRRSGYKLGVFAQGEIALLSTLSLNLGVRWDRFSTFGNTVNPRLAAIYKPFDGTVLKLLYGEAFRAPNSYELHYNDNGVTSKTSGDLKPETITTYEIVYEQYFGNRIFATVTGFHYDLRDLITLTTDPADSLLVFRNMDKTDITGTEVELSGKWENGFEARGSYSYQVAEDKRTGETLINSPMHLAKANIVIPVLPERLFAGIETQYTGRRKTISGRNAKDFVVANLTMFGRRIVDGLEFSASVYNIFDKRYGDPGGEEHLQDVITQDGRGFRFKLTYIF